MKQIVSTDRNRGRRPPLFPLLPPTRLLLLAFFLMAACGAASKTGGGRAQRSAARAPAPAAAEAAAGSAAPRALDLQPGGADAPSAPPPAPAAKSGSSAQPTTGGKPSSGTAAAIEPAQRRPLLIYTATLTLAVFEAARSIDAVESLARETGGYLVRRSDRAITVRVPAEKFDKSLETIAKVGDELHRDVSAQDITAEFRDLQTRLENLRAVRSRLQVLLERAKNVSEALQVERELERVTGEIERIKGRLKLYSELLAFSTITVNFQARPVEHVKSTVDLPFPWLSQLGLSELLDL